MIESEFSKSDSKDLIETSVLDLYEEIVLNIIKKVRLYTLI